MFLGQVVNFRYFYYIKKSSTVLVDKEETEPTASLAFSHKLQRVCSCVLAGVAVLVCLAHIWHMDSQTWSGLREWETRWQADGLWIHECADAASEVLKTWKSAFCCCIQIQPNKKVICATTPACLCNLSRKREHRHRAHEIRGMEIDDLLIFLWQWQHNLHVYWQRNSCTNTHVNLIVRASPP